MDVVVRVCRDRGVGATQDDVEFEGGGASRMRAAHASGGMDEMLAHLARESYSSTQTTLPIRNQS